MSSEILSFLSWDDNDSGSNGFFPKKMRCLVCGPSGSGKTQLVLNMILQKWITFNRLIVVSPSLFQPMYKVLLQGLQANLPYHWIINMFKQKDAVKGSSRSLERIIETLGNEAPTGNQCVLVEGYNDVSKLPDIDDLEKGTLVIFDDLMLNKTALKRAEEFFTRGRPMDISIIFISQSYYEVPRRTIRENCNFLVLFQQNKKSLEHLYRDEAGSDMDQKEFEALCKEAWKKKHSFLVVDKSSPSDEGKYRVGFNQFYVPKSYI